MNAIESFVGSFGILLVGFITIPLVGALWGAEISGGQGAGMGVTFFGVRWLWLYVVRTFFEKVQKW